MAAGGGHRAALGSPGPHLTVLGSIALWLAALFAAWSVAVGAWGARFDRPELIESSRRSVVVEVGLLAVALLGLGAAFVRHDFNVQAVALNSSRKLDPLFAAGAAGAPWNGFLLLLLVVLGALALAYGHRGARSAPAISSVLLAGAVVLLVAGNPFTRMGITPIEGNGLDPRLRGVAFLADLLLRVAAWTAAGAAVLGLGERRWRWLHVAWIAGSSALALEYWSASQLAELAGPFNWTRATLSILGLWIVISIVLLRDAVRWGLASRRVSSTGRLVLAGAACLVGGAVAAAAGSERDVRMKPGATATVSSIFGAYRFLHMGVSRFQNPDHVTAAATVELDRGGSPLGLVTAERRQYFDVLGRPVGEPQVRAGIRRGVFQDVQVLFRESTREEEVLYQFRLRPLVSVLWLGVMLLLAAGGKALIEERR